MSSARPRPIRGSKVHVRFVNAADRAEFLDRVDGQISMYRRYDTPLHRALVRRLTRHRRTLRGLVIGAVK